MTIRDWKTSQKYIRVGHNKAIRNYFKTVRNNTVREKLRNSLLIYKNDSASQMLVKMQYFQQYLSGVKSDTVPVIPEYFPMRIGSERPQLVVVFKPKSSNYPKQDSRWSLSIPHFDFNQGNISNQLKKIPDYEKGKHQGVYTLKDNSKIILYAKSGNEARKTIKKIITSNLIKTKYIVDRNSLDENIKVGEVRGTYKEVLVTPTYAKYFSTGQKNLQPDWVSFIE